MNITERASQLPEGIPPLSTYYIYLTSGCNLACRHCWISPSFQPHSDTGGHLDYELFVLAIEEGLPLGLNSVKLTGGEPLLHPDFMRMVDLLREKRIDLTVETNGTLLSKSLAEYLKDNSTLRHISVSLDGATPQTHDTFRGVKGSFGKTCEGIKYLVEVGFHPQVIMSLHSDNVAEIEDLIKFSGEIGAGSVKFNLIQPSGRGELMTERGQVLDIHRLIELGKWIEGDLQKRTSLRLYYSWPMAFHNLRRLLNKSAGTCGIFGILGILSTGHLAMCGIGVEIPELCYGLLGVDRVAEVWTSHPTLIDLRRSLPNELDGVCSKCIFRQQCLGSCVADNYHRSRRLTAAHWFCEQAESKGYFPVGRLHQ
jgi:SynChlorMet cassette radical SAM/SPASM protein ScmF